MSVIRTNPGLYPFDAGKYHINVIEIHLAIDSRAVPDYNPQ
jgi:hypothetical protein